MNTAVLNAYREANDNNDPEGDLPVWVRLRAYLANNSNGLGEVFSNAVQIKVRAYEPPVQLALPTSIYVCGNSIDQAWSTWKFCSPVFGKEGRFYTLIYNNADGFKWGNKANDWFGYSMISEFDNQVEVWISLRTAMATSYSLSPAGMPWSSLLPLRVRT
jgi:hypothetical protein